MLSRSMCFNCLEGKKQECERFDIEEQMREVGDEFFEQAVFDDGDDENGIRQTKRNKAFKATRYHLYQYYHFHFGNGGGARTPLPFCVEVKIKELYAGSDKRFVGFKEEAQTPKKKLKTSNHG